VLPAVLEGAAQASAGSPKGLTVEDGLLALGGGEVGPAGEQELPEHFQSRDDDKLVVNAGEGFGYAGNFSDQVTQVDGLGFGDVVEDDEERAATALGLGGELGGGEIAELGKQALVQPIEPAEVMVLIGRGKGLKVGGEAGGRIAVSDPGTLHDMSGNRGLEREVRVERFAVAF
jgi:hypothetical protein